MPRYEIKPGQPNTPCWDVWKDGVKLQEFTSRTAAQAYVDHARKRATEAVVSSREFRRFHNALKILRSIDYHELEAALSPRDWQAFRDHPWLWFITASDEDAVQIWQLIEARQQ